MTLEQQNKRAKSIKSQGTKSGPSLASVEVLLTIQKNGGHTDAHYTLQRHTRVSKESGSLTKQIIVLLMSSSFIFVCDRHYM